MIDLRKFATYLSLLVFPILIFGCTNSKKRVNEYELLSFQYIKPCRIYQYIFIKENQLFESSDTFYVFYYVSSNNVINTKNSNTKKLKIGNYYSLNLFKCPHQVGDSLYMDYDWTSLKCIADGKIIAEILPKNTEYYCSPNLYFNYYKTEAPSVSESL